MARVYRHIIAYITPHACGGMHFFRKVVVFRIMHDFKYLTISYFRIYFRILNIS